jgi:G:T-mismatch repair DNA endonuclease (very short patch repair protein)
VKAFQFPERGWRVKPKRRLEMWTEKVIKEAERKRRKGEDLTRVELEEGVIPPYPLYKWVSVSYNGKEAKILHVLSPDGRRAVVVAWPTK